VRFLIFYFTCGLIAALSQIAFDPTSAVPSLGASGAIAGVLGAYFVSYPTAPVDTLIFVLLIFIVRLPAWIVLGVWIVLQFFTGVGDLGTHDSGGVATFAHIGGFLAGLLVFIFRRRRGPPQTAGRFLYPSL
jgi:membrane associated rhomboid family serine protease